MPQHFVRHATVQQATEPAAAVCRHHHEIGTRCFSGLQDSVDRGALDEMDVHILNAALAQSVDRGLQFDPG
jgi:hypothetical protein